jgi:hypothetical protein
MEIFTMAQLMLINPRKRRRGASAARMAAIRPKRRRRSVARVSAPRRRRVALSRNPIARRHHRHIARRRIRRNPMSAGRVGVGAQVMNGLVGGAGGLLVDVVQGYIPVPAALATGYGPYVVKGALALLLGTVGRKFLGNTAAKMGAGAMTIAAYGALKTATAGMLPGTTAVAGMGQFVTGPGSRMGYLNPTPNMGEFVSDGGMYANGGFGNY